MYFLGTVLLKMSNVTDKIERFTKECTVLPSRHKNLQFCQS